MRLAGTFIVLLASTHRELFLEVWTFEQSWLIELGGSPRADITISGILYKQRYSIDRIFTTEKGKAKHAVDVSTKSQFQVVFFFAPPVAAFFAGGAGSLYHSPVDNPTPFGKLFSSKAISRSSCASSQPTQQHAAPQSPSQLPSILYRLRIDARPEIYHDGYEWDQTLERLLGRFTVPVKPIPRDRRLSDIHVRHNQSSTQILRP
jgi:hypothetical protein